MAKMNNKKMKLFKEFYHTNMYTYDELIEELGEDAALVFEKSDRLLKEIKANDLEEEYREFRKNVRMCGSLDMVGYMYEWE